MTEIYSGEWLQVGFPDEGPDARYAVGFEGEEVGRWSGGYQWRSTRRVIEAMVDDNEERRMPDILVLADDMLMHVSPESREAFTFPVDADGMLQAPSWAWYPVDAADCDRVVRMEEPPPEFQVKGKGTLVAVIYQKPGDEGSAYTLRLDDGSEVVIEDGEDDYWTLAGIIDARFPTEGS